MNCINFVEEVLDVKINPYQKELLVLIENNPKGYLKEVMSKHPSFYVKQVALLWSIYEEEHLKTTHKNYVIS